MSKEIYQCNYGQRHPLCVRVHVFQSSKYFALNLIRAWPPTIDVLNAIDLENLRATITRPMDFVCQYHLQADLCSSRGDRRMPGLGWTGSQCPLQGLTRSRTSCTTLHKEWPQGSEGCRRNRRRRWRCRRRWRITSKHCWSPYREQPERPGLTFWTLLAVFSRHFGLPENSRHSLLGACPPNKWCCNCEWKPCRWNFLFRFLPFGEAPTARVK